MAGADAGPIVAVEVFMEENEVAPMRIVLEEARLSIEWPTSVGTPFKERNQPALKLQ